MYFDNLTLLSLLIFAVAFGCFVYACLIRGCITDTGNRTSRHDAVTARDDASANQQSKDT